ncbi:MAG: GNVR domain-containing protein [Rhodocyclaceae bacterium]|nr:GNVR domain-containing protein [Rhodocyclaceae bacterium]
MDEAIRQILFFVKGMWSKRWIGLVMAWLVGVLGMAVVLRMPDKFEATARIYVDTQSVLKPLMSGLAVQPNVDQQINILSRTLISRPNIEKLVRMTDMDLKLRSKEDREKLIDELMLVLKIESGGQINLYSVAYRDSSPEMARKVVQALVTIFVESGIGDKRKDTDTARKFIEEQIGLYEKKLQEAENRLKDFKVQHMGQIDKNKDYFSAVGDMANRLEQAKMELKEAETGRDSLRRQLQGEEPVLLPDTPSGSSGMVAIPELDGRIDVMKRNLDALLQRYTDKHPDVLGARKVIADLEAQKRQEIEARKKASGDKGYSSLNNNPVFQQLKVSLSEAEANVASLSARVTEYQMRFEQMKGKAKLQPEVEAEFVQLNRDYDVNKKNYEMLVSRRESASMSEQMEATSAMADFRLIDPPRVSPKPVAPNRLLLLPLVLLGSLGAGAASALAMSQLRPTFLDAHGLREATGLPVLGSVSLLKSEERLARERRLLLLFFVAVAALVLVYGGAMLYLFFHISI